jgi:hypothetical protein
MPLEGENFKRNNKLVFQILKSACIKSMLGLGSKVLIVMLLAGKHGWRWLRIMMTQES